MQFTKKILAAGANYHAPNGIVSTSRERHQHWADMHAALTQAGYRVPVGWGHGSDDKPVRLGADHHHESQVAGHVDSITREGDYLSVVFDIPDAKDAKQVQNNLAFVSPVIYDHWKDGRGNRYEDIITHIDLVQHPVDYSQTEFVAMSLLNFKQHQPDEDDHTERMVTTALRRRAGVRPRRIT